MMDYTTEMPPVCPCLYYDDNGKLSYAGDLREMDGVWYGHMLDEESRKQNPETAAKYRWTRIVKWQPL